MKPEPLKDWDAIKAHLESLNMQALLAADNVEAFGVTEEQVQDYLKEIEDDAALKQTVE